MISEAQAAIIAAIRQTLGDSVKSVEPHPGDWSVQTLQRVIMSAPAVYVAWLGAKPGNRAQQIVNKWVVFIAAQTLNGVRADAVGTYQITDRLMAMFAGTSIPGVNAMNFTDARNLWSEQQSNTGAAMYALYYDESATLEPITPEDGLDDFLRQYQRFHQPSDDGLDDAPDMKAHINLPGPGENNEDR